MNIRQKRLADVIRTITSEEIMNQGQVQAHDFGIITVVEVTVNHDYDYADIFVTSQFHEDKLTHFIAPSSLKIRKRLGKEYSLRKVPILRFRIGKKQQQTAELLTIIHSLDKQYGLSELAQD